jgi:hypothetical protein
MIGEIVLEAAIFAALDDSTCRGSVGSEPSGEVILTASPSTYHIVT